MTILNDLPYEPSCTAFFTGHRFIPGNDTEVSDRVRNSIIQSYNNGYRRYICGCAIGFDTIAAYQTLRMKETFPDIILSLAIPCETQADRWTARDKAAWHRIRELSDEQIILSQEYYKGVMLSRNRYMADHSSLCICYLTHMHGGTAATVRYALMRGDITVVNLAVKEPSLNSTMRENAWNCTFISPSAQKNADTAPLCHLSEKRLTLKHISTSFLKKHPAD